MEKKKIEYLQETMDRSVEWGETAGSLLLVTKDGKEECFLKTGYADIENKKPLERNSLFRLYSMSKPVTAVAAMILLERGQIDLMDQLKYIFPSFNNMKVVENGVPSRATRDVNLFDTFNMTSGLSYPGGDYAGMEVGKVFDAIINGLAEVPGGNVSTLDFVDRMGRCPLLFQPGSQWAYGTGADIMGAVIEKVSGMSFGEFLRKEIFEPLGMKDTDFYAPESKKDRLANVYESVGDGKMIIYDGENLGIENPPVHKPAFESGGAGLISCIDDYQKFAQMLLNGGEFSGVRILSENSVRYLTSGQLTPEQKKDYNWDGLQGFSYSHFLRIMNEPEKAVSISRKGEYGWDGWLGCYVANIPSDNMSILIMTQKKDSGTFGLTRRIRNIVLS
ncbi:MAG: beta-lactamase family protein [Lachnospiraceae bacterium]|nr:beta-lactamase family protein [Lachnospiraceae bacterium]